MPSHQITSDAVKAPEYSESEIVEEIDFYQYFLILKRRWIPATIVFIVVLLLSVVAALQGEPVYRAEGKVEISSDRSSSLTGVETGLGQLEVLTYQGDPLATQVELIWSIPVAEETIAALSLTTDEGEPLPPLTLLEKLVVEPVRGTEVLSIAYESTDPEEAMAVVNQVISTYQNRNITANRKKAADARRFIEGQLPITEDNVLEIESQLSQFREQNDIVSLEQETSNLVTILLSVDQEKTQTETEIATIDARSIEILNQLNLAIDEAIALGYLNQSEGVQEVLAEFQRVQTELSLASSQYRPGSPVITNLTRQQENLGALLQERIRQTIGSQTAVAPGNIQIGEIRQNLVGELIRLQVDRAGLQERLVKLSQSEIDYRQRAEALPQLERVQRQLIRRLEAAQTTYQTLLSQLQEVSVAENQTVGNVQIVNLATLPEQPAGPDSKIFVAAGMFAGVLLAIATAFILDLQDRSVKTVKEAKQLFNYRLIGVIPFVKQTHERAFRLHKSSPSPRLLVDQAAYADVREAYHVLQTNLRFLQGEQQIKTILVSSCVPGEGKSETAANLGAVISQIGGRVLLIDANLRSPQQHRALDIPNDKGLSDLTSDKVSASQVIQNVMDGFDVLTAGQRVENPIALLDSQRMSILLNSLSQKYDFIIIDAPSFGGLADASILGKMADGVLLVVRPGTVNYGQGKMAQENIGQAHLRVLGMVANGIKPSEDPDYYKHHESYVNNDDRKHVSFSD